STVYAYNPSNGKLIAKIENPTSHDYGCTQIYVDRAGTSALQFTTTPISEYLTSKTIRVIPTNNNPSGNYNIRIYYTETEIAGWEAATSQVRASAVINKTSGSISSASLGSSSTQSTGLTQGLFGTDFWIEGNFGNGFSGFGVGLPPTPTPSPLELLSFRAVPESDWVRLSWSTASELNIARFVVEKSYDGKEFFGIGELSSGKNIYQFYDTKPIRGSNYYRLRIEETDKRSVSYSNVEVINWGSGTYLNVYPIPTDGVLNLELRTFEGTFLSYRVLSQLGVEVMQGELTLGTNESKKLALDLGHLSRGIYFLEAVYGQTKVVRKIVLH
ncbi:MAG: T9SS type A sorting domain-containing protein, partial [Thermonemataceae bacterium]|nr:T9SS type A sorting domain-containing protein [Thermonemataceae bacterium]